METAFSFMSIYLQMAPVFANGETFNQTESVTFWQQVVCEFWCSYISSAYTLLVKFRFST